MAAVTGFRNIAVQNCSPACDSTNPRRSGPFVRVIVHNCCMDYAADRHDPGWYQHNATETCYSTRAGGSALRALSRLDQCDAIETCHSTRAEGSALSTQVAPTAFPRAWWTEAIRGRWIVADLIPRPAAERLSAMILETVTPPGPRAVDQGLSSMLGNGYSTRVTQNLTASSSCLNLPSAHCPTAPDGVSTDVEPGGSVRCYAKWLLHPGLSARTFISCSS